MAGEFPHLGVRVTYEAPSIRDDSIASREARARSGTFTRRAWVQLGDPGHWTILEG